MRYPCVCFVFAVLAMLFMSGCAFNNPEYIDCCSRGGINNGSVLCPEGLLNATRDKPGGTDYSNIKINCSNDISGNCTDLGGTVLSLPLCAEAASSPCLQPSCTAMVCGKTTHVVKPMMTTKGAEEAGNQTGKFDTSTVGEAVGLYGTTCEFRPLDEETQKMIKRSMGKMYVNTFRFGVGSSFDDYEEGRLYFPVSDAIVSMTPERELKDRFTNYDTLTSSTIDWEEWKNKYPEECTNGSSTSPNFLNTTGSYLSTHVSYEQLRAYGTKALPDNYDTKHDDHFSLDLKTYKTDLISDYNSSKQLPYLTTGTDYEPGGYCVTDKQHSATCTDEKDWHPGALFECLNGGDCYSGYCNKDYYSRSACIDADKYKEGYGENYELPCPCKMTGSGVSCSTTPFTTWHKSYLHCGFKWHAYPTCLLWCFTCWFEDTDAKSQLNIFEKSPSTFITDESGAADIKSKMALIRACDLKEGTDYELTDVSYYCLKYGWFHVCKIRVGENTYNFTLTKTGGDKLGRCKLRATVPMLNVHGWCEPSTIATIAVQSINQSTLSGHNSSYCPLTSGCSYADFASVPPSLTCKGCKEGPRQTYGLYKDKGWPNTEPDITYLDEKLDTYLKVNIMPILVLDPKLPVNNSFSNYLLSLNKGAITLVVDNVNSPISLIKNKTENYTAICPLCLIAIDSPTDNLSKLDDLFNYNKTVPPGYPPTYSLDKYLIKDVDYITHNMDLNAYTTENLSLCGNYSAILQKKIDFARELLKRYGKSSLILRLHVKEDGSCWKQEDITNMLTYIFDHQRDLTDVGIFGMVYDKWNTTSSDGTGLVINGAKEDKFCSFQRNSVKIVGMVDTVTYVKRDAQENCTCIECNIYEIANGDPLCGTPAEISDSDTDSGVCIGVGKCIPPEGAVADTKYRCPEDCIISSECKLCNKSLGDITCTIIEGEKNTTFPQSGSFPVSNLSDIYYDMIASMNTSDRCCLLRGEPVECCLNETDCCFVQLGETECPANESGLPCQINEPAGIPYTYIAYASRQQKNEQVIFPANGDETQTCGKLPKSGQYETCTFQILTDNRKINCSIS
jgi:hypothetical protein